jgi:hypothetical protein
MGIANFFGHQRRCHIFFHLLLQLPAVLVVVVIAVAPIIPLLLSSSSKISEFSAERTNDKFQDSSVPSERLSPPDY